MGFMRTSIIGTDPLSHLLCSQHTDGFHDGPLPMDPLGLKRIQPGTFTGQHARDDAHAPPDLLDVVMVGTQPRPYQPACVPRRVVPHQQQGALAQGGQALAAPGQQLAGQCTHGLACGTPEPERLRHCGGGPQQRAIAGEGIGVGILVCQGFFHQAQRALVGRPGVPGRLCEATPPDFIANAEPPLGMGGRQADQAIAPFFFRAYAGSGLVIPCLARFHRVWNMIKAWRIVSPLTRRGVMPAAYATSAANSRVQTLVGWLKVRGL